jgi:hypothetical protein
MHSSSGKTMIDTQVSIAINDGVEADPQITFAPPIPKLQKQGFRMWWICSIYFTNKNMPGYIVQTRKLFAGH